MTLPLFSGLLMTRDNSLLLNIFITEINPVKLDDLPISVHIHWLMMFQNKLLYNKGKYKQGEKTAF